MFDNITSIEKTIKDRGGCLLTELQTRLMPLRVEFAETCIIKQGLRLGNALN